ncbi:prolyl oligopeptidase family serine peptidase [Chryseobacterium sp. FH1]|uniref:prolyl oligopeptidase family serine peptidase n=1 Tax=Chryseobacterium sp. FH1 TaxID=1233951 RepID=UPI0004E4180C|nr:prolyl oligopeptidase family serine peptidase [Chryseobacterium sp. FH1]KFC22871.1 hypothetical protein IO90_04730 [Chryseobacterium sp. FH1]
MKQLFTLAMLSITTFSFAQSYQNELESAASFIQKKDYCSAFKILEKNLSPENSSYFDYYYGSVSAVKCGNKEKAFSWLTEAKNKGLGLKNGEIDYLLQDENLVILHNTEKWEQLISSMKTALIEKENIAKAKSKEWVDTIKNNAVSSKSIKANKGYSLYFSEVGVEKVPYLVYIPSQYLEKTATKAIVYLHGGVNSIPNYYHENPDIVKEPIFQYGENHNTIIIYPFAKKDFGWVDQLEAFKNVVEITKEVQKKYNIDKNNLFLGGMSNGGTATFWFATQKKMPYKGYFSISAMPKLNIGAIDFKNISEPLYSINAKDDDVFKYEDVNSIYLKNQNKNWHFETIDEGSHGLIYNENGQEILSDILGKLIKEK